MTPGELIDRFTQLDVLVIGEAMLDGYMSGHVGRVCREAPVPIVMLESQRETPGGAANAAVAAASLGARCNLLSVVGQDDIGDRLLAALDRETVGKSAVFRVPNRSTLSKQRVSAHGQLLIRLDRGSEEDVDDLQERRLLAALSDLWDSADAVIVSDYGYGVCTPAIVAAVAQHQRRAPRILVADAKDMHKWANVGLTAAKPNYEEAIGLIDAPQRHGAARVEQIIEAKAALQAATGSAILTVTLDRAGAVVFDAGSEAYRTYTAPAADSHAAGAGDTFTAALALALAGGASAPQAADLAAAAATAVVAQSGTTSCSADMLRAAIAGEVRKSGLPASALAAWRASGKRIVFTNGCFDILHHGHIAYLNQAKAMGDVLVVGLNSDVSVRSIKGPSRPINAQDDRAAVLAALSSVDLVLLFDEATPVALIEQIRPDLFVKGGDYTRETLPEAALIESQGGEIKILPFLDNRSTTGIINRIRETYRLDETA